MNWMGVQPVMDPMAYKWCRAPYPRHPKGCPQWGAREGCPPRTEDISKMIHIHPGCGCWAVFNRFDLGAHAARRREKFPNASDAQIYNLLYWQPTARKQLAAHLSLFYRERPSSDGWVTIVRPEAHGVNVTKTMQAVGIRLEWPPRKWAYQIAFVGGKP